MDNSKLENSDGTEWVYSGNVIYKNDTLHQISFSGGRVLLDTSNNFTYHFDYRDIWNNLRIEFTAADSVVTIKQISDLVIGRFWQVDPLASQYAYNSVYAFQENKFGKGVELEGLELADFVAGISAALVDNSSLISTNYRADRAVGNSPTAFKAGETVGDLLSVLQGGLEMVIGGGEAAVTTAGVVSAPAAAVGVAVAAHGVSVIAKAATNLTSRTYNSEGKRSKNKMPNKGNPNSTQTNDSGTTTKKYGPDGNVQKEYNKGHGSNAPRNEQSGHVHDYKPNPNNPSGSGDKRYPGRAPKKGELRKDFDIKNN